MRLRANVDQRCTGGRGSRPRLGRAGADGPRLRPLAALHEGSRPLLFVGPGSHSLPDSQPNVFDTLVVDEAHRLNEKSGLYGNLGQNQITSSAKNTRQGALRSFPAKARAPVRPGTHCATRGRCQPLAHVHFAGEHCVTVGGR